MLSDALDRLAEHPDGGNITGGPPTVDQLRDTAGMTTCLDEQWRAAT